LVLFHGFYLTVCYIVVVVYTFRITTIHTLVIQTHTTLEVVYTFQITTIHTYCLIWSPCLSVVYTFQITTIQTSLCDTKTKQREKATITLTSHNIKVVYTFQIMTIHTSLCDIFLVVYTYKVLLKRYSVSGFPPSNSPHVYSRVTMCCTTSTFCFTKTFNNIFKELIILYEDR